MRVQPLFPLQVRGAGQVPFIAPSRGAAGMDTGWAQAEGTLTAQHSMVEWDSKIMTDGGVPGA